MKSFKNYTPDNKGNEPLTAEELTKKIANAYNGKSDVEMLKNILAEAERGKRAGTLSNAEIDAFYTQFSPLLDGSQRKKLKYIVEKLKKI